MRISTAFAAGAGALALALLSPASAQELDRQGLDRWSGFYIGSHAGSARAKSSWENINLTDEQIEFRRMGFAAGGHLGLQQQFGNVVAGMEITYSAVKGKSDVSSAIAPAVTYSAGLNELLTVTGRFGFAANQWLLYVKGGWASAKAEYKGTEAIIPDAFNLSGRTTGWVLGGGVEYSLANNLVLGLEYTRINLKEQSFTGQTTSSIDFALDRARTDTDLLMARISYKIGWPAREGAAPPR